MSASVYTVCQQFARLVKQVVPELHGHRCKTLGWLVIGIMLAKSVASAQVAEVLRRIRGTQASSQERTISRDLTNEGIEPQGLWQSFLPVLLNASCKKLRNSHRQEWSAPQWEIHSSVHHGRKKKRKEEPFTPCSSSQ